MGDALRGPGAVVSTASGPLAELIAAAGFGWVVIDGEHGALDLNDQIAVITAIQGAGARAMVRVARNDPHFIGFALDAGADGVIVPSVDDATAAEAARDASRYPPLGTRSVGLIRNPRPEPLCILQIETPGAVNCAAEIAALPGIDGLMIGPGDLALACGLRPGLDSHHPDMHARYAIVINGCRSLGIPTGTFALLGDADVAAAREVGFDFIASFHDRTALARAAGEAAATARAADDEPGKIL